MSSSASALLAWLHERGARTSGVHWPVASPSSGGDRSVAAAADAAAGAELLRVPGELILTSERALHLLAPILAAAPALRDVLADEDELQLALLLLCAVGADADDSPTLPPAAADEAPLAAVHELRAYVRALPPVRDLAHALCCWRARELDALCLPPSALAAVRARRAQLRTQFLAVRAALDRGATAPSALLRCLLRGLSWHALLWARLCVASRAFFSGLDADPLFLGDGGLQDMLPLAVVPLGDMFNHAAATAVPRALRARVAGPRAAQSAADDDDDDDDDARNAAACGPRFCDAEWLPARAGGGAGAYVLRAAEALRAGGELCISYGDRTAADLLEAYGFVLPWPANAHEALCVDTHCLVWAALGEAAPGAEAAASSAAAAEEQGGEEDARGAAWRRALEAAAADVLASSQCSSDGSAGASAALPADAAALAAAQRQLWEEVCAPLTIELPCAEAPGADALALLRLLAVDAADARELCGSGGGISAGSRRLRLSLSRLERPVSRANELRVLACLRLLAMSALAPILALHAERRRSRDGIAGDAAAAAWSAEEALAALRMPLAAQIAAARAAMDEEQAEQRRGGATAAAASADDAGSTPWPVAAAAGGDARLAAEAELLLPPLVDAPASSSPAASLAHRRLLASHFRQAQLAVGILHLLYVQQMLAVAAG